MSQSSNADERTMREIYLSAFETVVRQARPWTVMCSYNRINGVLASENRWLLTDVLRGEWGFDGYVMSDWGAVSDRVQALAAGLELEMPSSNGVRDRQIVDAVRAGSLDESVLDRACERILTVDSRYLESAKPRKAGTGTRTTRFPASLRRNAWCCSKTTARCRWKRATRSR